MEYLTAKPTIANETMTAANTEYSYEVPAGTKVLWVKLRDPGYPLQLCIVEGESNTTYVNLAQGKTFKYENIKMGSITLYCRSTAANQTAEILTLK